MRAGYGSWIGMDEFSKYDGKEGRNVGRHGYGRK